MSGIGTLRRIQALLRAYLVRFALEMVVHPSVLDRVVASRAERSPRVFE